MVVMDDLIKHFKDQKIILFLGPFFSEANGFPSYEEVIEHFPIIQFKNSDQVREYLREGDYLRAAEGCRRFIAETVGNEEADRDFITKFTFRYQLKRTVEGILYRLAASLPVKTIISLNLDTVLPSILSDEKVRVYTGRQASQALVDIENKRPHIMQVLGSIQDPESITVSFLKYMEQVREKDWQDYFNYIFSNFYSLFIGFERTDPVALRWLKFCHEKVVDAKQWYAIFVPEPSEPIDSHVTTINIEEFKTEDFDSFALKAQQCLVINQSFMINLITKTTKLSKRNFLPLEKDESKIWSIIDESSLKLNENSLHSISFFRGRGPDWAVVANGMDAPRDQTPDIKKFLLIQDLRVGLIISPGGWGKSTIARRVAYDLWKEENFIIIWIDSPHRFPPNLLKKISKDKDKDVLVIVDNAQDLSDMVPRLTFWKENGFKRLRILLVGRTHEVKRGILWVDRLRNFDCFKIFELQWISRTEAAYITDKLQEFGQLKKLEKYDRTERAEIFLKSGKGDLLASMLVSTEGEDLDGIMQKVCQQVRHWVRGRDLLRAYCIVAVLDSIDFNCTHKLFYEILNIEMDNVYSSILNRLPGELDLDFLNKNFRTRHTSIAKSALKTLLSGEPDFFDKLKIYKKILRAVGRIASTSEKKLASIIPLQYRKGTITIEESRELFDVAVQAVPEQYAAWQAWAVMESDQKNFEKAEDLFKQAANLQPDNVPTWHAWAVMEGNRGNFDRAEELYRRAADLEGNNATTWHAWAVMESNRENFRKAEELFKKAAELGPGDATTWYAWAGMKEKQGDFSTAIKYYKKAMESDPLDKSSRQALFRLMASYSKPNEETSVNHKKLEKQISVIEEQENESISIKEQISSPIVASNGDWPFIPRWVTDRLDLDQERIISYLLAGLAQRLGLTVVMVEKRSEKTNIIFPINRFEFYWEYCKGLFYEVGGEKHPCEIDMQRRAIEVFNEYNSGHRWTDPIIKQCHAGFRSIYYPLVYQNKILGLYIVGKWELDDKTVLEKYYQKRLQILKNVKSIFNELPGYDKALEYLHNIKSNYCKNNVKFDERKIMVLKQKDEATEDKIMYRFNMQKERGILRGLKRIDKAIALMHDQIGAKINKEFIENIDKKLFLPDINSSSSKFKEIWLPETLSKLRTHIGPEYLGLFLNIEPKERYLRLVYISWNPEAVHKNSHIYLDREKAKIPDDILSSASWLFQRYRQDVTEEAILGPDCNYFRKTIANLTPFSILGHTGAIVTGSLKNQLSEEHLILLNRLCFFFGLQIAGFYLLNEYHQRREKEFLGYSLFVHQFRKIYQEDFSKHSILDRFFRKNLYSPYEIEKAKKVAADLKKSAEIAANQVKNELDRGGILSFLREATKNKELGNKLIKSNSISLIEPIVKNAKISFETKANDKGMSINLDEKRDQNSVTRIEPEYLLKIVENLIGNAIYHGYPDIGININWGQKNKETIFLNVTNSGKKISTENKKNIINLLKENTNHDVDTGYGLALVSEIVQIWNGDFDLILDELPKPVYNRQKWTYCITLPALLEE